MLTLHEGGPGSIPGILNGPLSLVGVIYEHSVRSKSQLNVASNKNNIKKMVLSTIQSKKTAVPDRPTPPVFYFTSRMSIPCIKWMPQVSGAWGMHE